MARYAQYTVTCEANGTTRLVKRHGKVRYFNTWVDASIAASIETAMVGDAKRWIGWHAPGKTFTFRVTEEARD